MPYFILIGERIFTISTSTKFNDFVSVVVSFPKMIGMKDETLFSVQSRGLLGEPRGNQERKFEMRNHFAQTLYCPGVIRSFFYRGQDHGKGSFCDAQNLAFIIGCRFHDLTKTPCIPSKTHMHYLHSSGHSNMVSAKQTNTNVSGCRNRVASTTYPAPVFECV